MEQDRVNIDSIQHVPLQSTQYNDSRYVGRVAVQALQVEALSAPKPGLVDRFDTGVHTDMDISSLLKSAEVLGPFIGEMYRCGYRGASEAASCGSSVSRGHTRPGVSGIFQSARMIGIEAEKAMFRATGGINTHKGAIFTLGLLGTAYGYVSGLKDSGYSEDSEESPGFEGSRELYAVLKTAGQMVKGIVNRELEGTGMRGEGRKETAGERIYRLHGVTGIRGEAEQGFPSLGNPGLPILRMERKRGGTEDEYCVQTLLHLMTVVEDTNVVARGGLNALTFMRTGARRVLDAGGIHSEEGLRLLHEMNRDFIARNISPGGSADLLSAAIFLDELTVSGGMD